MNSSELLDAVKAKLGVASDNALARNIFKVEPRALKEMRMRGLSEDRAVEVAGILGLDDRLVLAWVRGERAKSPKVRGAWERTAKALKSAAATVAACSIVALLSLGAPEPAQASAPAQPAVGPMYIMSNRFLALLRRFMGWIGTHLASSLNPAMQGRGAWITIT